MPWFPVGHVEEPALDPLPEMSEPRTWNLNGLIAMGVVGALIAIVVALYAFGNEESSAEFARSQQSSQVITGGDSGNEPAADVPLTNLPDLVGQTEQEAVSIIQDAGAVAVIARVEDENVPAGQVIGQDPASGTDIGTGTLVTISVAK
jgi:hypothetical protein